MPFASGEGDDGYVFVAVFITLWDRKVQVHATSGREELLYLGVLQYDTSMSFLYYS